MKILSSLVLTAGLMFGSVANANIMVWLSPSAQPSSGTGDDISLTLMVGGLGNFAPSSLGAFDIDVLFDAGALSFTGYTLAGNLGDISLFEADDFSWGEYAAGAINLAEVSYLFDFELDALQPDMFALAELFFHVDALVSGKSTAVSLEVLEFSDGLGDSLTVDVGRDAVIATNPVPTPTTLLLLGFGLLAVSVRKNKFY
jgi:hypothetical protein